MDVFFNDKYVIAREDFDTTRKSGWIAEELANGRLPEVTLLDPGSFLQRTGEIVESIHTDNYINALKTGEPSTLASSQGFAWDPGIWSMALNSTAGVLAAVDKAVSGNGTSGSLSSGLHHASRDSGAGFCTVNGLAAAAQYAIEITDGIVVILDVDAHCGGGTHSLVAGHDRILHLDLSVNRFDSYKPLGDNQLRILTRQTGKDLDHDYLNELDQLLSAVPADTSLVIYNAGMDPFPAISAETLCEREGMVASWRKKVDVGLAFVLAGGYTSSMPKNELVDLHLHTLKVFSDSLLLSTEN
ncbi:MAG: hypothetical protein VX476_04380 [Actinomycetota bacterium]|nr:hypothetical protein [Actinomycetota bacterium]